RGRKLSPNRGGALLLLSICLSLCFCPPGQGQKPPSPQPDGNWWLNAKYDEQDGFVIGYADCASFLLGQPGPEAARSQITEAVTEAYDADVPRDRPVISVMATLFKRWQRSGKYKVCKS
ncbi:MAG: hypothetical protein ACRD1Y_02535, partial [Terriglobales bacterium]